MEPVTSPVMDSSPNVSNPDLKSQDKALLAEARATRDMLVDFRSAIESGSYDGVQMYKLARGLAFLEAILKQNNAHISALQERLNGDK